MKDNISERTRWLVCAGAGALAAAALRRWQLASAFEPPLGLSVPGAQASVILVCVLLMAAEGEDEDNFAPVRALYEGLTSHMGWRDLGAVYAGGNFEAGAIHGHPEQLRQAESLGKSI